MSTLPKWLPALLVLALASPWGARATVEDACAACHQDKKFLVQNKKLYDYYENWRLSVHAQEGLSCADCHGGNPKAKNKSRAHAGKSMGAAGKSSAVNFRNIPSTCAACHDDVVEGYKKSQHYKNLSATDKQGPSCVTCHGSVNAAVLDSGRVRRMCSNCHSYSTGNHPEVPEKAEYVLNRFLSIHRLYRYIGLKGDPTDVRAFLHKVDPLRSELAVEWHTFNLDATEKKVRALLDALKEKRNEIRKARKTKN